MDFWIHFLIFIVILFLYIHVVDQHKKSEDLEIYEMDYSNNSHLQEICNLKQPILFEHPNVLSEKVVVDAFSESGSEVKIYDTNDFFGICRFGPDCDANVDPVSLSARSSLKLVDTDSRSHYFTEGNGDFIMETGLDKHYRELDTVLQPSFTVYSGYDLLFGSQKAVTPLRYHTNHRHFLYVSSGKMIVKMCPWRSRQYLHVVKDFDHYHFRSPVNVWKPQEEYKNDLEKVKFLEFNVGRGFFLYIPPYWFYSIQFSTSSTVGCAFTYNTPVHYLANVGDLAQYYIQQFGTKEKVVKTLQISLDGSAKDSGVDSGVGISEGNGDDVINAEETVKMLSVEGKGDDVINNISD